MKNLVPFIVVLLVGIGIGIVAGVTMSKTKVEETKARMTELEATAKDLQEQNEKLKSSRDASEAAARKATSEMVRIKNGYQKVIEQLNANLTKTNAELAQLKGATAGRETTGAETASASTASTATATVATTDYVVKDGDSLWKIAEMELDNGLRYKEILKLNPNLSEDKPLVVGTKIKLPSQ